MRRTDNPQLDRLILNHLADLYKLKQKRVGVHLSTLVYCITRSFFDSVNPVEPTDEEVMLFALGLGLQAEFTPAEATTPVYEKDGITFSPDFVLKLGTEIAVTNVDPAYLKPGGIIVLKGGDFFNPITTYQYAELKTTRGSMKKYLGQDGLPETWIEYIKGGCYIREVTEYNLAVLYMMGNYAPPFPTIHSETLIFEPEELTSNWDYLLGRREVYDLALLNSKPPEPFKWNKGWECKNCRYLTQCQAVQILLKGES